MQQKSRRTGEQAFFAASNSRYGFHSYYEQVFRRRVDRLFCIKGGPGTGKSTFMRAVAREGERQGYRAEYYYCSSDADSLDAVLLFGKTQSIGLIDATAPHAFEPTLPGVREDIVDLGQFWDSEQLGKCGSEIMALNRQKSDGYRAAYRHLSGAGELSDAVRDLITPCLDTDKLQRTCSRLLRGEGEAPWGHAHVALSDSIGMRGRVRLDTYLRGAERLCLIEDYHDAAYALTELLDRSAAHLGLDRRISYHPILPDRIDALWLIQSNTAFVVCQKEQTAMLTDALPHARVVYMGRMMSKERLRAVRDELRRITRLRDALIDEAWVQMQKVAKAHFSLEQVYTAAMDFAAKERFTVEFCHGLFDRQA